MKQQINLYQVEKQKWIFNLSFQYLAWGSLVFLLLLLIMTSNGAFKHFSLQRELTQLQKAEKLKSKKLALMTSQIPEEGIVKKLVEELKKYETEKQLKQDILDTLAAKSAENKGFSDYLEALSLKTMPGLWFTKLSFQENGKLILLEGSATNPEYVPNLIMALSSQPGFSGKNFQLFKESFNEKTNQIDFVLETKSAKKP